MKSHLKVLWISVVRTVVPMAVGAVGSWLTVANIDLPPEALASLGVFLTAVLTAAFGAVYYLIARVLEERFPKVGVLLGFAQAPVEYAKDPVLVRAEQAYVGRHVKGEGSQ